ncbi:hypothetical protein DRP77_07365 [Candidatus Poribacteria bacterium]|nr:MAG: hypothetical protein DRP77_07365 [Candidatus Poribacteria bacterium]
MSAIGGEIERLMRTVVDEMAPTRERIKALRMVANLRTPEVSALILRATVLPSEAVAQEAMRLVEGMEEKEVFKLLDHILANSEALGYLGPKMFEMLYKLKKREVLKYLIVNAVQQDNGWSEKRRVLDQWLRNSGLMEKFVDMLPQIEGDLAKTWAAILKRVDDRVVFDIARLARSFDRERSIKMLDILVEIADNANVAPLLVGLLSSEDKMVRSKAALVLGKLSDNLHFFQNALNDPDPRVRANAIEGLWGVKNPKAREIFLRALEDENNRVRANAAKGLYEMGDPKGLETLKEMLNDHDEMMRASAAWVLGEVGDTNLVGRLEEMAESDPADIARRNAIKALRKIFQAKHMPVLQELGNLLDELKYVDPVHPLKEIALLRELEFETLKEILASSPPPSQSLKWKVEIISPLLNAEPDVLIATGLISAIDWKKGFFSRLNERVREIEENPEKAPCVLVKGASCLGGMFSAMLENYIPSRALIGLAKVMRWVDKAAASSKMLPLIWSTDLGRKLSSIRALRELNDYEGYEMLKRMGEAEELDEEVKREVKLTLSQLRKVYDECLSAPDALNLKATLDSLSPPLISLRLAAFDEEINPFFELKKENVLLIENGRVMDDFEMEVAEGESSLIFLMDYSNSMTNRDISFMERAVEDLVSKLGRRDRVGIIKFAYDLEISEPAPASEGIKECIRSGFKGDRDGTLLYDAIWKAVEMLRGEGGRRSIIVLTDGDDSGSKRKLEEVIRAAAESGVRIYTIGLNDQIKEETLRELASSTGGEFAATSRIEELRKIYQDLYLSIQGNYKLSFTSEACKRGDDEARLIVIVEYGHLLAETALSVDLSHA